jgi:hypothetical protein
LLRPEQQSRRSRENNQRGHPGKKSWRIHYLSSPNIRPRTAIILASPAADSHAWVAIFPA